MISKFCHAQRLARRVRVVFSLTALSLAGASAFGQIQPKSPVGPTWDCLLGGARNGVAYITFANDGTFSGYEVLVPRPLASPKPALVRVIPGGNGLGAIPSAPAATNRTEIFGSCPVNGTWGFDSKGRIVGSFLEKAYSSACTPTAIPLSTNFSDSLEPVSGTNAFLLTFSSTFPVSTNKDGTFKNQTISYMDRVAVSTNSFDGPQPITATNVLASGYSVTQPILTNMVVAGYTELTTCYAPSVAMGSSTFESLTSITATNFNPDGTFWITLPVGRTAVGNYIEETTFYAAAPINTNISETLVRVEQTNYLEGIFCTVQPIATNVAVGTYKTMTVSYLLTEDCASLLTNTINFVGTVAPGKRLNLLGKSSLGGSTYHGVPSVSLPDMSGAWRGLKLQQQTPAYEFFNLTDAPYTPNSYAVSGSGPGYTYGGLALLSSQKKIALACDVLSGTSYQTTRAVFGSYNMRKASSSAAGLEAASGAIVYSNRVSFQFSKRTSLP